MSAEDTYTALFFVVFSAVILAMVTWWALSRLTEGFWSAIEWGVGKLEARRTRREVIGSRGSDRDS